MQCIIPTWYLSVDTQLFIIAPFLVYLIHRYQKITLTALLILILSCIGYTIPIYVNHDIRIAYVHCFAIQLNCIAFISQKFLPFHFIADLIPHIPEKCTTLRTFDFHRGLLDSLRGTFCSNTQKDRFPFRRYPSISV